MTEQQTDKSLPGGQEKIVRAVERTLAATARREQPGVKITNLASGVMQVEVHAYVDTTDEAMEAAGAVARAEYDRQHAMTSVPTAELEQLRWLASIGKAHLDADDPSGRKGVLHDIDAKPGHRARQSVVAEGPAEEDPIDDLMSKLKAATDAGVPGMEVSDA